MTSSTPSRTRRVTLYVREELPKPTRRRRRAVVDALETLTGEDVIRDYDVVEWPKRYQGDGTGREEIRDRHLAFEAWAQDAGVSLDPFFGRRQCYSGETAEKGEYVVLPALCLAIGGDAGLQKCYPHRDGDLTYTVEDGLNRLADGSDVVDSAMVASTD